MNLDTCLQAIAKLDSDVKAFSWHDPQVARSSVEEVKAGDMPNPEPLAGLPIAIKDIYDTIDMPTEYGSRAYLGHRPERDAWVVSRLRSAGAIVVGKTVTTEFAYTHAGPTRNPHNLAHTPGGSSSGSAAAVAAGMVPVAIGSQTGGSTIRPSAYCGVVGFKPTFGLISLQGVMPLAPSLDTVGIHAQSVELAQRTFDVLCQTLPRDSRTIDQPLTVGWYLGPRADDAQIEAVDALRQARQLLEESGICRFEPFEFDDAHYESLCHANRLIMAFEAARAHQGVYQRQPTELGESTRELIKLGLSLSKAAYEQAQQNRADALIAFHQSMQNLSLVLTLSAPGEAPRAEEGTGSSVFNQPWTTLGCPCITQPVGKGPQGLPLGIQFIARHGDDKALLAAARRIEQTLATRY